MTYTATKHADGILIEERLADILVSTISITRLKNAKLRFLVNLRDSDGRIYLQFSCDTIGDIAHICEAYGYPYIPIKSLLHTLVGGEQ